MRTIIGALPASVELWFLKTDVQGHDFAAVKGAGDMLRRVQWMKNEVQIQRQQMYEGVDNDFCDDFWPYLTNLGFDLVELASDSGRTLTAGNEGGRAYCAKHAQSNATRHGTSSHSATDAYWVRRDGPRWHPPALGVVGSNNGKPSDESLHIAPFARYWGNKADGTHERRPWR